MFGSEILEVAIGLFLVYTLLSLVCTATLEWITTQAWLGWLTQLTNHIGLQQSSAVKTAKEIEKRKANVSVGLLVIGFLTSCSLNVDTLEIATRLYEDDALRARVVAVAENLNAENEICLQEALANSSETDIAITSQTITSTNGISTTTTTTTTACSPLEAYKLLQAQLEPPDFPIGWEKPPWEIPPTDLARKIVGIFLTAVAVSLGAPFWHDLLKHTLNIRKPPTDNGNNEGETEPKT